MYHWVVFYWNPYPAYCSTHSKLFLKYGLTEKNMLPSYYYNNHHFFYDESIKTRHMLTGLWGKDLIEYEKKLLDENKSLSIAICFPSSSNNQLFQMRLWLYSFDTIYSSFQLNKKT